MSPDVCIALLLDGPMQSWGHASRFERRTTALHPTRSGVLGLIAAAMGIDKYAPGEAEQLRCLGPLRLTTLTLSRKDQRGESLPMRRLEDYHTVTGIRRASGKVDEDATVQTYRHYLLDARFGVLLDGPVVLLDEVATALRDPNWGLWFGRKSCLPACPVLAAGPGEHSAVWAELLRRAGLPATLKEEEFDRVMEVRADEPGADRLDDTPVAYGAPVGNRHAPRWIKMVPRSVQS